MVSYGMAFTTLISTATLASHVDDPAFAIAWPTEPKVISERDAGYPNHQG